MGDGDVHSKCHKRHAKKQCEISFVEGLWSFKTAGFLRTQKTWMDFAGHGLPPYRFLVSTSMRPWLGRQRQSPSRLHTCPEPCKTATGLQGKHSLQQCRASWTSQFHLIPLNSCIQRKKHIAFPRLFKHHHLHLKSARVCVCVSSAPAPLAAWGRKLADVAPNCTQHAEDKDLGDLNWKMGELRVWEQRKQHSAG